MVQYAPKPSASYEGLFSILVPGIRLKEGSRGLGIRV